MVLGETAYIAAPKGRSEKLSGKRTDSGRNSGERIAPKKFNLSGNRTEHMDYLFVCFFVYYAHGEPE
jgi:hypothetical protein